MLQLWRATRLLFGMQLASLLRSRRTHICALLALGPVAFAMLVGQIARHEGPAPAIEIGWFVQIQVVVPILSLVIGSAAVSSEVEDRTLTYLFSRPIPRMSVLLGRWLASVLVLWGILLPSTAAMLLILRTGFPGGVGSDVPAGVFGPLIGVAALGVAVYTAVFSAAGTFVKYPMVVGLGYVFAVENLLANVPGNSQGLAIQFYLRSVLVEYGSPAWAASEGFQHFEFDPGYDALVTLGLVLAISLAVGCYTVSRKQYVLSA